MLSPSVTSSIRCRSHLFGSALALSSKLAAGLYALKDVLAVLVKLELGDDDVARVDAERDRLARGLLAGDTLNVDLVLETVDADDLALTTLVATANDLHFIILSDGDAADVVLLTELLAERSAHDVAADRAGSLEVGTSGLAAGRRDIGADLHLDGCFGG